MTWLRALPALLLASAPALAADWPQWLGPGRDGATPEKVAPWKEELKILWRQPVGEGHGSPVIAGGRVYVHARVKDKNAEEVVAFDTGSGKEVWRTAYPRAPFESIFGTGPRATPLVAGDRVYAFGVTGILTALDTADGKKVWQVDTLKQFNAKNLFFGMSCSPILAGDKVLVNVGGKGASVVAFDAGSGATAWQALDDPASYSSPIRLAEGKDEQVVFLTGKRLVSLNPADGKLVWDFPLVDRLFESSITPQRMGNLLLASSITYGTVALRLEKKNGKPVVEQAWKSDGLTCYFSTPVAAGKEQVYLVTGSNPLAITHEATLRCVELSTGKVLWSRPKVGTYHAALVRTGDGKLLLLEENGSLVLLEPNPKEYRELARAKVCGETWAHPAIADGRLYVRDKRELVCIQLGE